MVTNLELGKDENGGLLEDAHNILNEWVEQLRLSDVECT
jgi:hypothetical protein